VKQSFFEKLKERKAEASRLLTESQFKLEIPSVPTDDNDLNLNLETVKKKVTPAPIFTNE
jgi:hypothetical protein